MLARQREEPGAEKARTGDDVELAAIRRRPRSGRGRATALCLVFGTGCAVAGKKYKFDASLQIAIVIMELQFLARRGADRTVSGIDVECATMLDAVRARDLP
jgi:hypothetical protein